MCACNTWFAWLRGGRQGKQGRACGAGGGGERRQAASGGSEQRHGWEAQLAGRLSRRLLTLLDALGLSTGNHVRREWTSKGDKRPGALPRVDSAKGAA